jgi:nonsense-mediated mRNA decay protein 3
MKKFCPKCGRPTEKFYENLCKECFLKSISFLHLLPDKIVLKKCKLCGRFFLNDRPQSVEKVIENFLLKNLKSQSIESITYRITEDKLYLTINSKFYDLTKTEEKTCELITKFITCKFCWMKQTGYHQAIIQIRGEKKYFDEILRKMEAKLENLKRTDELAFISKIDKNDFIDIYVGSSSSAMKVINWLRKFFKIKTKLTKKLIGVKSGKRVYRTTILVRIS